MHDQLDRRYVGPFGGQHGLAEPHRAAREEGLGVEGDHVGAVDVVAHVFLAQVLEAGVAAAADPAAGLAGPFVVFGLGEDGAVGEFVDQVGGDDHRVGQQQGAGGDRRPVTGKQQADAADEADEGVGDGQAVGQAAVGVAVDLGGHGFLQRWSADSLWRCRAQVQRRQGRETPSPGEDAITRSAL